MNKAFTKEDDGGGPERLPDLPVSGHPNHVTPQGLRLLRERQAALAAEVARLKAAETPDDLHARAVAERDLRYVEARVATAILVAPPDGPAERVQFGATVTVADADGREADYTIVGEDEAAPDKGLIAYVSPLARALLEAEPGDVVDWVRPTGTVELEVVAVRYRQDAV